MSTTATILSTIFVVSIITCSSSQDIGDECDVLGISGICKLATDCEMFKTLSASERRAVLAVRCGFRGTSSIICCPKKLSSKEVCDQLIPRPNLSLRILNGEDAIDGDFPQFAALGYQNVLESEPVFNCAGVLISKNFVLTAAHCLNRKNPVILVRLGTIALKAGINFDAYIDRLDVEVKVRHHFGRL